jgi:hypothetical protein
MSAIVWKQASVAGVKLQRFIGHVGDIEVGFVEYDGAIASGPGRAPLPRMSGGTLRRRQARNRR